MIWRVNAQPPRALDSIEPSNVDRYWMEPSPGMTTWFVHEIAPEGSETAQDSASPEVQSSLQRFDAGGV